MFVSHNPTERVIIMLSSLRFLFEVHTGLGDEQIGETLVVVAYILPLSVWCTQFYYEASAICVLQLFFTIGRPYLEY